MVIALTLGSLPGLVSSDPAAAGAPAAPGCSTAEAVGPTLSNVETSYDTQPEEPFGVAISADDRTAFVADASGAILVYSLASATPTLKEFDAFDVDPGDQRAPLRGLAPLGVALTPDGRDLIAAAGDGAIVFSVAGLERAGTSATQAVGVLRSSGEGAIETAVSPDGTYVFVTLEDSDELAVFNLSRSLHRGFGRSDLVGTVPLGVAPVGVAVAPGGGYLYVTSEARATSSDQGTLTTIDMAEAERDPARAIVSTVDAGCSPVRVVATSTSVYVTARGSDAVLAFDAGSLVRRPGSALEGEVQVGEAPVGLALVHHDRDLVVADSDRFSAAGAGSSLAVVAIRGRDEMSLQGYVRTGAFPRDMAVSPHGTTLLVGDYASGQLEAVNVRTLP
jgi:DNA-binding beta-propeller fold protein YncE